MEKYIPIDHHRYFSDPEYRKKVLEERSGLAPKNNFLLDEKSNPVFEF